MSNFLRLLKGEFIRLVKYRIVLFGLIVSAIWVLILALSAKAEAEMLFPYLVTMDTGMMSIVLFGADNLLDEDPPRVRTSGGYDSKVHDPRGHAQRQRRRARRPVRP